MNENKRAMYMRHIENEWYGYRRSTCCDSPAAVFSKAGEIVRMGEVYDYLHSEDISDDELNYVMSVNNPIKTVYSLYEAFQLDGQESSVPLTVYDIYTKRLLDDGIGTVITSLRNIENGQVRSRRHKTHER